MKKLAKKEIGIGLSVIVAIVILIFGIDFLKGINLFRPANFYLAYYENVDGLEVSAPVKVNGFKVGQVREINFDYSKPGRSEVVLALNKNLKLPEDSRAVIASSLLGEAYIEIKVGNATSMIPVGGEVATSEAQGLMSSLSEGLMPKVNETLSYVDSVLININSIASDPALRKAMGNLEGISDNVALASQGFDNLLNRQVPSIVDNLNGVVSNANGLLVSTNGLVGRLGNVMGDIDATAGNLTTFSRQLTELPLNQTMENVNATVANLESFSAQLKDKNSTLGMLMNDPELYNRLNSVAASVDSLIVDIKRNPKRYISIKLL